MQIVIKIYNLTILFPLTTILDFKMAAILSRFLINFSVQVQDGIEAPKCYNLKSCLSISLLTCCQKHYEPNIASHITSGKAIDIALRGLFLIDSALSTELVTALLPTGEDSSLTDIHESVSNEENKYSTRQSNGHRSQTNLNRYQPRKRPGKTHQ